MADAGAWPPPRGLYNWRPQKGTREAGQQVDKQDRQFLDVFMVVIGVLIGVAVGLIALARFMGAEQAEWAAADDRVRAEVEARIAPMGRVITDPEELGEGAAVIAQTEAPAEAPARDGAQVYQQACQACHTTGVGGAPMTGDEFVWEGRIAQGMDLLYERSIDGYMGDEGYMPPRGGRMDLSDEEVRAAVDYMVERSQ